VRRVAFGVAASLFLLVSLAATPATARKAPSPQKQVRVAFGLLIKDTQKLPRRAAKKARKTALVRTAKRARKQSRRRPCASVKTLRGYKRQLKGVRIRKNRNRGNRPTATSPRGRLQARLLNVNAALLQTPKSKRCGGGRRSRVTELKPTVLSSDERQLKVRVQLPPPQFVAHQAGGKDFLEMTMEGMDVSGDVGKPGVPMDSQFFGIPEGASVDVDVSNVQGYTVPGVQLYPLQKQPVDLKLPEGAPDESTFLEPPFRLNEKAYDSGKKFPSSPVDGGSLGAMRDVLVGAFSTAGGQYSPRTDKLKVFTSMDVTVDFGGDNKGNFGPDDILSPWNHAFQNDYAALINRPAVFDKLRDIQHTFCGEELLIVTSNELRPAANTLATQRAAQGYSTKVVEVGSGPGQIGTTPSQIQAYIRGELNSECIIRPSYVILFGNTAHVPTFLVPCSPGGNPDACNIASDLDYSTNGIGTDLFADVQLGRLPAPDLAAANALVTKLQSYITTSPAPPGDDFFDHAAVTSYFQPPLHCVLNEGETGTPNCDENAGAVNAHWEIDYPANTDVRGFTITAERIRNAIAGDGYTVDRLYTTDDEDVIPLYYWNGTPIPSHLRRPTFAWDANTTDFFNTYNEGRFVILHRDHGWPDGWAEPTLHSGHVPFFTNGSQQPVVFGINCASAAFDTPAHPSFVELQLLRPDGGAIAGFGDTRVSPSFPNNHMALGFFDAMFPLAVPDYGDDPGTRRLGDILIKGKQYMATQEGFEWHGAGDTYVEHYLYHLLGDPTMQMWAAPPVRFDPSKFRAVIKNIREVRPPRPGDPPFIVQFQFPGEQLAIGSQVTVFRGDEAIGRGIVGADGIANVIPDKPFGEQDDLSVSLQQDGAFPEQEAVEKRQPTQLSFDQPGSVSQTGNPNTFAGQIAPPIEGAQVRVVYTPKDPTHPNGTITHTVTTGLRGGWNDQVSFSYYFNPNNPNESNHWTAQAFFDGDDAYAASASNTVDFFVGD
jgi:Peptidase family C25/Propeptide_C25